MLDNLLKATKFYMGQVFSRLRARPLIATEIKWTLKKKKIYISVPCDGPPLRCLRGIELGTKALKET